MEKKFIRQYSLIWLCALGMASFSSCVDDAYDLSKDIDMTVTIGGDLTVPGSNTDEVKLKDVLDIEDDSVVKADSEGNYSIVKDGEGSDTDVTVDGVNISGEELDIEKAEQNLSFKYISAAGEVSSEEDFNETTKFNIKKSDITEDLVALNWAELDMKSELVFGIKNNSDVKRLWLKKGFSITFPAYMTVVSDDPDCTVNEEGNVLTFNKDITIERGVTKRVDLRIVKMDFTHPSAEGQGLTSNHELIVNADVNIDGKAYISSSEFVQGETQIDLTLESGMEVENIELKEVNGIADPKIDISVDPITIDNLPDFLSDDDVKIEMTDPRIYLTLTNESPVSVNMSAELIPYKNGERLNTVVIGNADSDNAANSIIIPGNKTNYTICLHKGGSTDGLAADKFVVVENLNDLIATIPDEIKMENVVAKATKEDVTITMGETYNVRTDYKIDAPLMFSEGTNIIYTDSLDGWSEDIDKADFNKVEISMDVINRIPLELNMNMEAIDINGDVLSDVKVDVEGNIAAGTTDNPTTKTLKVTLTSSNGAVKRLDGIKFRVECKGGNGLENSCLNENQSIKIDNLKLKLIGGITMDLN